MMTPKDRWEHELNMSQTCQEGEGKEEKGRARGEGGDHQSHSSHYGAGHTHKAPPELLREWPRQEATRVPEEALQVEDPCGGGGGGAGSQQVLGEQHAEAGPHHRQQRL